ncbi:uncharacterized protein LOC143054276 [Mytilus galloprovincialis]|uniref:uncharacterized protein LOC143054276 n=1 Tax=Mytilus galloprovincialis TaxID=29158 RepID=UPI003F7CB4D2
MNSLMKFVKDLSCLIVGISVILAIGNCDNDFNLTFYNERKTWSEAKDFCFVNGGILETDETIIIKDHDYTKDNVKLWLGAYSLITPWSGVFGCYFWNEDDRNKSIEFELQNKEECQIRCPKSIYECFAFKEKTCYCLNSENLPQSHDDTSPKKCSDSTETDYVFIYRQIQEGPDIDSDTYNCIAVECKNLGRDRVFTAENCDSMYNVLCDNTENRSTINAFNATKFCEDEGSFVRWDPSLSCTNSEESFDQKHWTSIKRSKQMFLLTASDENVTLKPLQCIGLDTYGDMYTFVEPSVVNCTELRPFYCRYRLRPLINSASNESQGHNVTMEMPDNSHITPYLIPGAIAGTTLLAIIIGVVIFVFRRRSTERKSDVRQDVQRSNNAEQIGHGKNLNRYSYSEVKVEGSNQHVNMIDNGDDQYTTGTSDVYDHLNENKKRKIKTENPHAIYDHAIADNAEPDYDSTKHVVQTNPDYQEVRIGSKEEIIKEKL